MTRSRNDADVDLRLQANFSQHKTNQKWRKRAFTGGSCFFVFRHGDVYRRRLYLRIGDEAIMNLGAREFVLRQSELRIDYK